LPRDWERRRRETFREHGDICWVCGQPGANEVDHVKRGDDHSLNNLKPIHGKGTRQRCHQKKSSREGVDARRQRRNRMLRKRPHPGLIPKD